jgi:hypothetical protein
MKTRLWLVAFVLLFAFPLLAQEHYTEGPVWRLTMVKVKASNMDEYFTALRQSAKPLLEEEKRSGMIMDYQLFIKESQVDAQDWNIMLAVQFRNHAALDGLAGKAEALRDKMMGGKQGFRELATHREEIRTTVSEIFLQQITLK